MALCSRSLAACLTGCTAPLIVAPASLPKLMAAALHLTHCKRLPRLRWRKYVSVCSSWVAAGELEWLRGCRRAVGGKTKAAAGGPCTALQPEDDARLDRLNSEREAIS